MTRKETQKGWRRKKKEAGFCSACGKNKPRKSNVVCDVCLKENAERKARWKKEGRCLFCDGKANGTYCLCCSYNKRTVNFSFEDRQRALLDLKKKKNHCRICGSSKHRGMGWALDHDHKTNRYRGLLCMNCNAALGLFQDSVEILQQAIACLRED